MTVKDLIKELDKLDPEMIVVSWASNSYDVEDLNGVADHIIDIGTKDMYIGTVSGEGDYFFEDPSGNSSFTSNISINPIPIKVVTINA